MKLPWRVQADASARGVGTARAAARKLPFAWHAPRDRRRLRRGEHAAIAGFVYELSVDAAGSR